MWPRPRLCGVGARFVAPSRRFPRMAAGFQQTHLSVVFLHGLCRQVFSLEGPGRFGLAMLGGIASSHPFAGKSDAFQPGEFPQEDAGTRCFQAGNAVDSWGTITQKLRFIVVLLR
jgi:hypothetical protein